MMLHELLPFLLLCSLVVLMMTTVGTIAARQRRTLATGSTLGIGSLMIGAVVGGAGWVASTPYPLVIAGALTLGVTPWVWRGVARDWATRGLIMWAFTVNTGVLYLVYVVDWTARLGLSPVALIASGMLWLVEVFVFLLALTHVWELVDVMARRQWHRTIMAAATADTATPFVSLHVPTHNEPPELVIETLKRLADLDYPAYEVVLIDNNTTDEALWRPVEWFCAQYDQIKFLHVENLPGYKSGALNYALAHTDDRAAIIGVFDADYQVEPDFLSGCAPLFDDDRVAFVQTPQDYREWEHSSYFRRLYRSYAYFFDVSQRSRNERDGAIFGGTMGLIRRRALVEVGGWDEWCITEDAELSLRLLHAGWSGRHVERSFGYGIMPLTFEALKRQRFGWCFGGVQMLRMHGRSMLPWDRSPTNHLSQGQRWAYLSGGLQWFADLAGLAFTGFLLTGAFELVVGGGLVIRRLSGFLLWVVLTLVVLGFARALALMRHTSGSTWREAVGAFGIWMALGLSVASACVRGLFARQGAFLVTPKSKGGVTWQQALRGNRWETACGALCVIAAGAAIAQRNLAGAAIGGLLVVQGTGYSAALLNSVAALRTDLSAQLRGFRGKQPAWGPVGLRRRVMWPAAIGVGVAVVVLVAVAVLAASPPPDEIARDAGVADIGKAEAAVDAGDIGLPAPAEGAGRSSSTGVDTIDEMSVVVALLAPADVPRQATPNTTIAPADSALDVPPRPGPRERGENAGRRRGSPDRAIDRPVGDDAGTSDEATAAESRHGGTPRQHEDTPATTAPKVEGVPNRDSPSAQPATAPPADTADPGPRTVPDSTRSAPAPPLEPAAAGGTDNSPQDRAGTFAQDAQSAPSGGGGATPDTSTADDTTTASATGEGADRDRSSSDSRTDATGARPGNS